MCRSRPFAMPWGDRAGEGIPSGQFDRILLSAGPTITRRHHTGRDGVQQFQRSMEMDWRRESQREQTLSVLVMLLIRTK